MAVKINYDDDENAKKKRRRRDNYIRDVSNNPYADALASWEADEEDREEGDDEVEEDLLDDVIKRLEEEPLHEGETREDRDRLIKLKKKQAKMYAKEQGRSKALGVLKLSSGRLISLIIVGLLWSAALVFITYTLYMRWVKYPPEEPIDHTMFGMYCLENWMGCLSERDSGNLRL